MKITFILSRFPWPLDKGDKLRAYYQMQQLALHHQVNLIALTETKNEKKSIEKLNEFCHSVQIHRINIFSQALNIAKSFLNGKPLQVGYFYNSKIYSEIQQNLQETKPDVVFCQLIRTAEYGKNAKSFKILDYQDALSMGLKRRINKAGFFLKQILKIEYKRLIKYENLIFNSFDKHLIITEVDRNLIPHPDRENIIVVPNGVDLKHFIPRNSKKTYDIIFAGNMNYPPNVDAALFLTNDIMPLVWKTLPDAKLILAGANPATEIKNLEGPNVHITGWVDDISEAYASAKVFVAPMRIGTGLQNKLLEAMAMKIPAVTTSLANEALKATNNESILVGDSFKTIAEHLINLLNNNNLYDNISQKGFDFVINNYSWEKVDTIMNEVLSDIEVIPN